MQKETGHKGGNNITIGNNDSIKNWISWIHEQSMLNKSDLYKNYSSCGKNMIKKGNIYKQITPLRAGPQGARPSGAAQQCWRAAGSSLEHTL